MRLTPGVNPIKKFPSKITLFLKLDELSSIEKILAPHICPVRNNPEPT